MKRMTLGLGLLTAALLGGCVVVPAHRGYGYAQASGVVVDVAPPAPYVEVQPALPYPGAVWISGYWGWSSGRYSWVPGYYDRPRAGYRYEPHRWEQESGRWRERQGGWRR